MGVRKRVIRAKLEGLTHGQALDKLMKGLTPARGFRTYFWPAHVQHGVLYDIPHKDGWTISIDRVDEDGCWDYGGETLEEAVIYALEALSAEGGS